MCARTSAYGSASSALPAPRLGLRATTPSSLMLFHWRHDSTTSPHVCTVRRPRRRCWKRASGQVGPARARTHALLPASALLGRYSTNSARLPHLQESRRQARGGTASRFEAPVSVWPRERTAERHAAHASAPHAVFACVLQQRDARWTGAWDCVRTSVCTACAAAHAGGGAYTRAAQSKGAPPSEGGRAAQHATFCAHDPSS